jgi:hypothetical protein
MMFKLYMKGQRPLRYNWEKIVESKTIILARFAAKPEPNPVEDLNIMRVKQEDGVPEELDYKNAPSPEYSVEDLVKMIPVKNPRIPELNKVTVLCIDNLFMK